MDTQYNIYYKYGTYSYTLLSSVVDYATYYIHSPVTAGTTYTYRISAVNVMGVGADSNQLAVLASQVPD
jgi:hypothetical protein